MLPVFNLTRRQRRAVMVLGVVNLLALIGLGILLVRAPSTSSRTATASPLAIQRVEACRHATSEALFKAGHIGMVNTHQDGRIAIQLQRPLVSDSLRPDADAGTWAALEAITTGGECLRFNTIEVSVDLSSSTQNGGDPCQPVQSTDPEAVNSDHDCWRSRATARLAMADLVLWSLGEIDDAELSRRVEYRPPFAPSPDTSEPVPSP